MIGQILSHYRIEEKLGEGGMGVVYRATDLRLDRPVAIKVLAAGALANPERKRRFVQEAKTLSALNHPNIVTIHEIDTAGGVDFLVMEYVRGKTLFELLPASGMGLGEVLKYAIQTADALAAAHAEGIVHRDLKPANIMVTEQGLVKVLDFGVAKLAEPIETDPSAVTETRNDAPPRTAEGTVLGTVAYMSPEQAEGKRVDARSDIFSLGSVLYELLTGRQAFQGASRASVLAAILRDDPAPAHQISGAVPVEMENIVVRCLRKDAERRFQSAADLRVVLQELADQKRTTSPVPAARRRTWLWAAPLAAGIALALLVATPAVRQQIAAWFSSPVPAQKQIAVLPFQNVGGEPANQAFCDGLAETLTSALSQLEQFQGALWVVPASEVRRESISGVRAAQQAFGVNLVITGSVQRVGDRLRLTANLVDARTVRQLAARSMDTPLSDITTLQDGVVAQVADLLEVELQPQARSLLAAGNTSVSNAYNLYLQGRGHLQAGKLEDAIADFRKAAQQDPAYALAYAGLGEASLGQYRLTKDRRWLEDARQASGRAVALNERLPSGHVNLGVIQTVAGRHEEAIRELHRALELNAVHPDALRELATAYAAAGRVGEAETTYRKAIQLRPGYWLGHKDLGVFYIQHGRYADAEQPFRKVIELIPDHYVGYRNLGGLYHLMGRYDEAEHMFKKSIAIRPTNFAYLNLGTTYFFQGRYRDAVAMDEKALESGVADYVVWGNLADAYRWTPEFAAKAPDTYRRAIQEAEKQLAVNLNDAGVLCSVGVYWARLGNKDKALAELEKARRLAPKDGRVAFKAVLVYELAGSRDLALAALEAALRGGYSVTEIRGEPDLAQLRKDPRCERLLAGAFLRR